MIYKFPARQPHAQEILINATCELTLQLKPGDTLCLAREDHYEPGELIATTEQAGIRLRRYSGNTDWKTILGRITSIRINS